MENDPFPPPVPPLPPDPPRLRAGPVVRDVAVFWGLTLAAGFVIGFVGALVHPGTRPDVTTLALGNLILGTVTFVISGCLVPPSIRWTHLALVALFAWLTSFVNVLFFGASVLQWVFAAIFITFIMGLGGAISCLFNRGSRPLP